MEICRGSGREQIGALQTLPDICDVPTKERGRPKEHAKKD